MERLQALRLSGAALAFTGAMAMGACGVDNPSLPDRHSATVAPMPGDAYPTIDGNANVGVYAANSNAPINMDSLTTSIELDPTPPAYEPIQELDPITKKEVTSDGFPWDDSAPVLDVMAGSDGKLHYKNYLTGELSPEQAELLAAVKQDSTYLAATMRAGKLDNVKFRVQKPEENPNPDLPQTQVPAAETQDVHGPKLESNIYYFLPGTGTIDGSAVKTILNHEDTHATLGHGKFDLTKSTPKQEVNSPIFTPPQKAAFENLAKDLRHAVAQEAPTIESDAMEAFDKLEAQQDEKYHPTMDKVRQAINNGEYDTLPTIEADPSGATIPASTMQDPIYITRQLLEQQGIDTKGFFDVNSKPAEDGKNTLSGEVADDWNNGLEQRSVLAPFTESQLLSGSSDTSDAGHLQDGETEMQASAAGTVLSDPEAVANLINKQTPEDKAVDLRLADTAIHNVEEALPREPAFRQLAESKLAELHSRTDQQ